MVTAFPASARVKRTPGCGEEVLPCKVAAGIWVFVFEGGGEVDFATTGGKVLFVKDADAFDLAAKVRDDGIGQGGDAVLFAFAIADGQGFVLEIDILDAQAQTFHEAQARTVEDLSHKFVHSVHLGDHAHDLFAAEDSREAFGAFGGGKENGFDLFLQDFAIEEEDGGKSLVLGGGGNGAFGGKVDEEGVYFRRAHFEGMAFFVEEDIPANPVHVGFFGAVGVVFGAQGIAHSVEDFFCHGCLTWRSESV